MTHHKLVIAEKPSVAQSIAAVLGATKRNDGYLSGNGYLVPKIIRSGTAILRLRTFPLLSKAILIAVSFFSSLKFIQYLTTKLPPLLFTVL